MNSYKHAFATYGATTVFILLWSSGAIFSRWGLNHASPLAFLVLRFTLALSILLIPALSQQPRWPARGTRITVVITGLLLNGGYSICYLLAMEHGVTPGVLATILGVQPILTLVLLERRFPPMRIAGLLCAMGGLVLVVYPSILLARFSVDGLAFGLGALMSITSGAILQKRIKQAPATVLPLQYAVTLLLYLAFVPFQPFEFQTNWSFLIPLLWLALMISVVAQLLFYRLIQRGNLVNVTSLLYLVPVVTAAMDYLFLGNAMPPLGLLGMMAVLAGLGLVFRKTAVDTV